MKLVTSLALAVSFACGSVSALEVENSDLKYSQTGSVLDDTSKHIHTLEELTAWEKMLAKQWMLEDTDWVKYKNLMEGPRGTWSPDLDPITVLGVSEENAYDRKRYAEIWMKLEMKRTQKELAFEVARMEAGKRLTQGMFRVNAPAKSGKWIDSLDTLTTEVGLFVEPTCIAECRELFEEVKSTSTVSPKSRLNIFFPDGTSADDIGVWAQAMQIDPQVVRDRRITLNFDEGMYAFYDVEQADLPEVRVRDLKSGKITKTFTRW